MNPQRFEQANIVMLAPKGMDNCSDVHAFHTGQHVITAWRPTPEELVKINLGEPVWIWVFGKTMPPVAITCDDPFDLAAARAKSDAEGL